MENSNKNTVMPGDMPFEVSDNSKIAGSIPPFAQKPVRTAKDAKKMLGKLIHAFQFGHIDNMQARTLTYMLISFAQMVKDTEFEERLEAIEKQADRSVRVGK
jgi:hypothetical protein